MSSKHDWKTVDFMDLCRYDKEFQYAVEVKVNKDGFSLGNKGDYIRMVVSEYGFNRLLWDELDGLIDITGNSLFVRSFNYPEITDEMVSERIEEMRKILVDAITEGRELPKGLGFLDD